MLSRFLASVVGELTRDEARAELELVEGLSAEAVGLGVRPDGILAYDELGGGIFLICNNIYLLGAVGKRQQLLRLLALTVVDIADRTPDGLTHYVLARKLDTVGDRLDQCAFTVYIIILFLAEDVNRADDIPSIKNSAIECCQSIAEKCCYCFRSFQF